MLPFHERFPRKQVWKKNGEASDELLGGIANDEKICKRALKLPKWPNWVLGTLRWIHSMMQQNITNCCRNIYRRGISIWMSVCYWKAFKLQLVSAWSAKQCTTHCSLLSHPAGYLLRGVWMGLSCWSRSEGLARRDAPPLLRNEYYHQIIPSWA